MFGQVGGLSRPHQAVLAGLEVQSVTQEVTVGGETGAFGSRKGSLRQALSIKRLDRLLTHIRLGQPYLAASKSISSSIL
jgi:hypothetical protein